MTMLAGDLNDAVDLSELLESPSAPPELVDIAIATRLAVGVASAGRLDEYQQHLTKMESRQRKTSSRHYLGVTLLNGAIMALMRGQARLAVTKSAEAMELLRDGPRRSEFNAAQMCQGRALAHVGEWRRASQLMQSALSQMEGVVRNEALVEAAEAWVWYGDAAGAARLVAMARSDQFGSRLADDHLALVEADLLVRTGRIAEADQALTRVPDRAVTGSTAFETRKRFVLARRDVAAGGPDAQANIDRALDLATRQRADLFMSLDEVLAACIGDEGEFDRRIARIADGDITTYRSLLS